MLTKRNSSSHLKSCEYTVSECVYPFLVLGVAIQFYHDMRGGSVIDRDMGRHSDDFTNDCRDLPARTAKKSVKLTQCL